MNESQLKAKVIKMLKNEFPNVWIYKVNDRFTSGIPDLILCVWGWFVAIELKTSENKKRNPLQEYNVADIERRAGGKAAMCRSVDEVRQILKKIERTS